MLRARLSTCSAGDRELPRVSNRSCQTPVESTNRGRVPSWVLFQPVGTSADTGSFVVPKVCSVYCSEPACRQSVQDGVLGVGRLFTIPVGCVVPERVPVDRQHGAEHGYADGHSRQRHQQRLVPGREHPDLASFSPALIIDHEGGDLHNSRVR